MTLNSCLSLWQGGLSIQLLVCLDWNMFWICQLVSSTESWWIQNLQDLTLLYLPYVTKTVNSRGRPNFGYAEILLNQELLVANEFLIFFFATLVFWWRGLCVLCCGGGGDIHCGSISTKLFLRPLKFLTKYFMMDWGNTWNKEEEVGLFFVWLQRLLMTEFNTTFPTVLCIFPSLLQFIPPSEKASTFTSQKICSHFLFCS